MVEGSIRPAGSREGVGAAESRWRVGSSRVEGREGELKRDLRGGERN